VHKLCFALALKVTSLFLLMLLMAVAGHVFVRPLACSPYVTYRNYFEPKVQHFAVICQLT
jgi:hypothetical protein